MVVHALPVRLAVAPANTGSMCNDIPTGARYEQPTDQPVGSGVAGGDGCRAVAVSGVLPGRYTADMDGDFVVFLIGMRPNSWWKVHRWLPVARAMQRMLRELAADPHSGFLGANQGMLATGPTVVQYWRSFADLERFARDPNAAHLPAWRRFNQKARRSGAVGIWHETYVVRAGAHEAIYADMPRVGLAAAGRHVPIVTKGQTAARRIGHREHDLPVAGLDSPAGDTSR